MMRVIVGTGFVRVGAEIEGKLSHGMHRDVEPSEYSNPHGP
jgi:hypothetical protein